MTIPAGSCHEKRTEAGYRSVNPIVMNPRGSVLLFAAGWMLLAFIIMPATASEFVVTGPQALSAVIVGTSLDPDNNDAAGQVHPDWHATREGSGISCCRLYPDSQNLSP
jgi:hypothetical protein